MEDLMRRLKRIRENALLSDREKQTMDEAMYLLRGLREPPKARVLTAEEVMTAPAGTTLWEECLDGFDRTAHLALVWIDDAGRIGDMEAWVRREDVGRCMKPDMDGGMMRWWNWKPSEEERRAAAWNDRE